MSRAVQRAGVVGAGALGSTVALDFALHGVQVATCATSADGARRAGLRVDRLLGTLVDLELVTPGHAARARTLIRHDADLCAALDGVDHVVEAAPEDLTLKRQVVAGIERHVDDDVVVATATTALPVTEIAAACRRPERVLATHYTLPAHLVPVVTVIPGARTTPEHVAAATTLLSGLGKRPVVLDRDTPGGIAPRLLMALMVEACRLADDGVADPPTIDRVITGGFGRRLGVTGVFDRIDVAGLDTVATGLTRRGAPVPAVLADRLAAGALGRKAGRGFYDWPPERADEFDRAETAHLGRLARRDGAAAACGTAEQPVVAAEVGPGVLAEFLERSRQEYLDCTPDQPPRCFAILLGHVRGGLVEVRAARFTRTVRAEHPSADRVWRQTIVPRFGPAYGNDRRGWWADPRDLLAVSRAADAEGLDIVGSVHLHPDWHRIGPEHERCLRISEEPTAMDSYLFAMTRWPLNMICFVERAGAELRHTLAAWAPPPPDDPDGPCTPIPLYGGRLTVPPVRVR